MDPVEHRRNEAANASHGLRLRLEPGNFHVRARILPLESVVLPQDAGTRAGISQEGAGELVPGMRYGAGERAGGQRLLLASRIDSGRTARARTMVLEDYGIRR